MELTNIEMSNYLSSLRSISDKITGKLAYAVARNIRKISNELIEFDKVREEHIRKYGTKNDNGEYVIHKDTEAFDSFVKDMEEYAMISHDVDIYMVDAEDVFKSNLTADEILKLDFMIRE